MERSITEEKPDSSIKYKQYKAFFSLKFFGSFFKDTPDSVICEHANHLPLKSVQQGLFHWIKLTG